MTHKSRYPRGRGTYYAQMEFDCRTHGMHEILFSSTDDLAWDMARSIAGDLKDYGAGPTRLLIWFRAQPPHKATPRPAPRGAEIEDDIPF